MENILVSNTETTALVVTGLLGPTGDITPSLQQLLVDTTAAKNSATASAGTATAGASTATAAANTAATAAGTATSKAAEALTSASTAAAAANTAATSAGTAATKAAEASASASTAATAAGTAAAAATAADSSAASAAVSAGTATTKAAEAGASAALAGSSKDTVAGLLATFRKVLLGSFASDALAESFANTNLIPITDGILYENTVLDKFRIYTGTVWQDYDSSAQVSQSAAALSAADAGASASSALASANNAQASAVIATTQASTATTQAGVATTQAGVSSAKATQAAQSAQDASTQAQQAASSATVSNTQATTAGAFAGTASTQAGIATTKATEASASATAAAASASAASTSQTAAASSASAANTSASNASASASTATTQATTATTQAGIATAQATTATTQAGIATTQATAASSSATTAVNAANTATAQATVASTKASEASASASNSQASATAAATAQTSASASASTATAQATLAGTARTAAETARDAAIVAQNNAVAVVTGGTATLTPSAGKIPLSDAQGKIAKGWLTNTDLVEQTDIGTAPNEIPLNQFLGELAYMDAQNIPTLGINVVNAATANVTNLMQVTEISNAVPSLNLDFAKVKQLDPRITFTRASTGTYYDGKTVAKAEENLLLQSQEFGNAAWNKVVSTVTSNSAIAPDGTNTATLLTVTSTSELWQQQSFAAGTNGTVSVWVKAATTSSAQRARITTNNSTAWNTGISQVITLTDQWQRIVLSGVLNSGFSVARVVITSFDASRTSDSTCVGNVLIWGAQLEQRASATAYTPTTTQAVTTYIPVLQTAAAGTPRFDHNPITGESLGLLIEEQRTNLLTYSETFDSPAWTKTLANITANSTAAPDGTLTADTLIAPAVSGVHFIGSASFSSTLGLTYTSSIFAKAAGAARFVLKLANSVDTVAFDLSAVTVTNSGSSTGTITSVGNGWFRCTVTSPTAITGSENYRVILADSSGNITFTGNGYSGIYIWGAQLEAVASATSYIPTVASQVTRAADSAVMTGANFSSWFNQAAGTFSIGFDTFDTGGADILSGQGVATGIFYSSTLRDMKTFNGTSGIATANTYALNTLAKAALSYDTNGRSLVLNAGTVGTSTGIFQSMTQLSVGQSFGSYINGTIRKLTYYPQRLSNAELVEMTA